LSPVLRPLLGKRGSGSALASPAAGPLTKPPQAAVPPALRLVEEKPVEWLKIRVPEFNPTAKVVTVTVEIEGEVARDAEFTEDADIVELTHVICHNREWPLGCLLAVVNTPKILQDGLTVHIRKKTSTAKIEMEFVHQAWDLRCLSIGLKIGRG
jgi:hypothetical protein